jgi:hypothetical protein
MLFGCLCKLTLQAPEVILHISQRSPDFVSDFDAEVVVSKFNDVDYEQFESLFQDRKGGGWLGLR